MAKKELGYVELEWTCPKCGNKNPGLEKTCRSCGGAQPQDVAFELPSDAALLTDQAKIQQAEKGPDIHCPYCGTRNPADAATCAQCGGDLTTGIHRETGQVVGAYSATPRPVQQIPCPSCTTLNPDNRETCMACGARLHEPAPAPLPAAAAAPRKNNLVMILGLAAGVLVLALCAFLAMKALSRSDLTGAVQATQWERVIPIQELRDVTREDWRDEVPSGARLGSCSERLRRTQDNPAPGAKEVCSQAQVEDTGSGAGKVVQECKYEIYDDYCSYVVKDWTQVDVLRVSGQDLNPQWPQLSLASGQREGSRQEEYTILFETEKGEYEFTTSDESLYLRAVPGSEWTLTINGFNAVVGAEPGG